MGCIVKWGTTRIIQQNFIYYYHFTDDHLLYSFFQLDARPDATNNTATATTPTSASKYPLHKLCTNCIPASDRKPLPNHLFNNSSHGQIEERCNNIITRNFRNAYANFRIFRYNILHFYVSHDEDDLPIDPSIKGQLALAASGGNQLLLLLPPHKLHCKEEEEVYLLAAAYCTSWTQSYLSHLLLSHPPTALDGWLAGWAYKSPQRLCVQIGAY